MNDTVKRTARWQATTPNTQYIWLWKFGKGNFIISPTISATLCYTHYSYQQGVPKRAQPHNHRDAWSHLNEILKKWIGMFSSVTPLRLYPTSLRKILTTKFDFEQLYVSTMHILWSALKDNAYAIEKSTLENAFKYPMKCDLLHHAVWTITEIQYNKIMRTDYIDFWDECTFR